MQADAPAITAFILAGGKSTRMGRDKALLALDGQTLLERALTTARTVAREVRIVGDPTKFARFAPVIEDIFPNCGPLGGIHAALRSSATDLNLVLAVDIPFVPAALLQNLVERADRSGALVTVPRTSDGTQPLCAVYRRKFADVAERALKSGRYKIDALFDSASTQFVDEDDLKQAGFSAEIFRNLNTPQDLAEASKNFEKDGSVSRR